MWPVFYFFNFVSIISSTFYYSKYSYFYLLIQIINIRYCSVVLNHFAERHSLSEIASSQGLCAMWCQVETPDTTLNENC
jgi:hypothetical protein